MPMRIFACLLFLCSISWEIFFFQQSSRKIRKSARRMRQRKRLPTAVEETTSHFFRILDSSDIYSTIVELSKTYPNLVTLTSAQARFGLPAAGGSSDCPHEPGNTAGCKNWIITLEDKLAHPKGSDSWKRLPEVFISGALHGDERVGPTSAVQALMVLLLAADCEVKQHLVSTTAASDALACREKLRGLGIYSKQRRWLARLVTTRKTVIVPALNSLGYYQNKRTENGIDPNRDFPFETDPNECMQTIAARTANELFVSHMFQQSLTFHGGMEVIAFEWGNPFYGQKPSPDHFAQEQIARAYSDYGGKFGVTPAYPSGKMNDLVYPVNGGMEDWAYAGSWDSSLVAPCSPNTFGGYSKYKTIYSPSVLRTFNMLIETSTDKNPDTASLGSDYDILNPSSVGNGHVPRNIRLILLMIELVEPYVQLLSVGKTTILSNGMIPTVNNSCAGASTYDFQRKAKVVVKWTVGGAFEVDNTYLIHGPKHIFSQIFNCSSSVVPTEAILQSFLANNINQIKSTKPQQGKTRWHKEGPMPITASSSVSSVVFSSSLDLSTYSAGKEVICIALAKVDQSWSQKSLDSVPESLTPQSHIVKVRTDPTWRHENAGKYIQGHLTWVSLPLLIRVN